MSHSYETAQPTREGDSPIGYVYKPSDYAKTIVALIVGALIAVIGVLQAAFGQYGHHLSAPLLVSVALGVLTAPAIAQLPYSFKWYQSAKFWGGVVAAVLQALLPFVLNGFHMLTLTQWVVVLIAFGGAFGVSLVPNTRPTPIRVV